MKTDTSKSGLFLMELIMSVLFFALAASVCIQMFVKSHIISRNSVELNHSVEWCQNIAEVFYGCDGNLSDMNALFSNSYTDQAMTSSPVQMILLFDDQFQPVSLLSDHTTSQFSEISFQYYITLSISEKDGLIFCNSEAFQNKSAKGTSIANLAGDSIYKLENILYVSPEVSYEK